MAGSGSNFAGGHSGCTGVDADADTDGVGGSALGSVAGFGLGPGGAAVRRWSPEMPGLEPDNDTAAAIAAAGIAFRAALEEPLAVEARDRGLSARSSSCGGFNSLGKVALLELEEVEYGSDMELWDTPDEGSGAGPRGFRLSVPHDSVGVFRYSVLFVGNADFRRRCSARCARGSSSLE